MKRQRGFTDWILLGTISLLWIMQVKWDPASFKVCMPVWAGLLFMVQMGKWGE